MTEILLPEHLQSWRKETVQISRKALARILNVSEQTIVRWEGKESKIDKANLHLIETFHWLFEEIQNDSSAPILKTIFYLIVIDLERREATNDYIKLKNIAKGWFKGLDSTITLGAALSGLPFGFIGVLTGAAIGKAVKSILNNIPDDASAEPAILTHNLKAIIGFDEKTNTVLLEKLRNFAEKFGSRGLLYAAALIKEDVDIF